MTVTFPGTCIWQLGWLLWCTGRFWWGCEVPWAASCYRSEAEKCAGPGTGIPWTGALSSVPRQPAAGPCLLWEETCCCSRAQQPWGQGICIWGAWTYPQYSGEFWAGHFMPWTSAGHRKVWDLQCLIFKALWNVSFAFAMASIENLSELHIPM